MSKWHRSERTNKGVNRIANQSTDTAHLDQRDIKTLLTKQFSDSDPPIPSSYEEKCKLLNDEMALFEAASNVVDCIDQA